MPMTVHLRREVKGRAGKPVTTVSGLAPLGDARIAALATDLKRRCACGGTAEAGGVIVLQGDHRDAVAEELAKRGFVVKRAGG